MRLVHDLELFLPAMSFRCAGALGLEERIEEAAVLVLRHRPRPRNGVGGAHVDHAIAAIGRR